MSQIWKALENAQIYGNPDGIESLWLGTEVTGRSVRKPVQICNRSKPDWKSVSRS